jgi:YidC/Oxa1 family membrane protein insertase
MTRQMNLMMPLMFGLFALQFASGLSIYFIVSNLVGIAQYKLIGGPRKSTAVIENKPAGKASSSKVESNKALPAKSGKK